MRRRAGATLPAPARHHLGEKKGETAMWKFGEVLITFAVIYAPLIRDALRRHEPGRLPWSE